MILVASVMPESSQLNSAVAWGLSPLRSRKWRSTVVMPGAFITVPNQYVFRRSFSERMASEFQFSVEQRKLGICGSAKRFRRKVGATAGNSGFAAGHVKQLVHLLRENSLAAHPLAEFRVVEFPAAQRTQTIQDFFFLIRKMV